VGSADCSDRIAVDASARTSCCTAATPDTLQRRFLNTGGIIENNRSQTIIRLSRRTYSPVLGQATLPETITVPWWNGRTLRYQYD
jgi:hypothetical protein